MAGSDSVAPSTAAVCGSVAVSIVSIDVVTVAGDPVGIDAVVASGGNVIVIIGNDTTAVVSVFDAVSVVVVVASFAWSNPRCKPVVLLGSPAFLESFTYALFLGQAIDLAGCLSSLQT